MVILGIDPGLAITGYGLVEEKDGGFVRLASGCIRTTRDKESPMRLEEIFNSVDVLISQYRPAAMAVEQLFFARMCALRCRLAKRGGLLSSRRRKTSWPYLNIPRCK